ncbi:TPA: hypothetical protein VG514_000459 [Streptococcus pyogenes]|nr:hypothetical protein [Streptococcus pyogenes]HEQ5049501.1 hypothetical protein [Streptococcus pyogenes]
MSFPSAYSLELGIDLSAKEAYDFSRTPVGSSYHLTDAKMFQCGEKYTFYSKTKQEIQLEKYFVNLAEAGQRGINLEDIYIYYDTATVNYHLNKDNPDNSYFLIRFHHVCSIDNVNNRPTIIINETKSQHHGVGYKIKILKRAAKDGEPLKVFFFGSFIKHPNKKFINPNVSPIDILDYLVFS